MRLTHRNSGILLTFAYVVFGTLFAACISIGLFKMNQTDKELTQLGEVNAAQTSLIEKMRGSIDARVASLHKLADMTDKAAIREESQRVLAQENVYTEAMIELGKTLQSANTTPEALALFDKLQDTERASLPLLAEAEWLAMRNSVQTRHVLAREVKPQQSIWLDALDQLGRSEHKRNAEAILASHAAYRGAVILTLLLAACPLAAVIGMFILAPRPLRLQAESRAQLAARIATRTASLTPADGVRAMARRGNKPTAEMQYLRDRIRAVFMAVNGTPAKRTPAKRSTRKIAANDSILSPQTEWQHSIMPTK